MVGRGLDFDRLATVNWILFGVIHATWVFEIALALVLRGRHTLSLRSLRWIELAVVGLPFLHQCASGLSPLFRGRVFEFFTASGISYYNEARGDLLPWFALIVGYAVVIPNT